MKSLTGRADGVAEQGIERCYALLADVESYPTWYPQTIKSASVLERDADGRPAKVSAELSLAEGMLRFDQAVPLDVALSEPSLVRLTRMADGSHDKEQLRVEWRLQSTGEASTRVEVELGANLNIPAFLPGLNSVADGVARGFLDAALGALRVA